MHCCFGVWHSRAARLVLSHKAQRDGYKQQNRPWLYPLYSYMGYPCFMLSKQCLGLSLIEQKSVCNQAACLLVVAGCCCAGRLEGQVEESEKEGCWVRLKGVSCHSLCLETPGADGLSRFCCTQPIGCVSGGWVGKAQEPTDAAAVTVVRHTAAIAPQRLR
jgi:hypothetical protein